MIKKIVVGPIQTNCYIVSDEARNAVVIDPGGDLKRISEYIKDNKLKISYIIQTHGHYDHIEASTPLQKILNVPILIRSEDEPMFSVDWTRYLGFPFEVVKPEKIEFLDDKEEINVGTMSFQVIHTPGHSPGGVCLYLKKENILFSGDTLFCDGIGRTDIFNGSYAEIMKSIKNLFSLFPDDTRVFPGHGPETTIGREKMCIG